jgi:hypothetical protein
VADAKISALTAATVAEAANEFAINEAGTSKKLTASLLRDLIGPSRTALSSDHTNTVTQAEVTGLSQTLVAGTYTFSYYLMCQSDSGSYVVRFSVNYTGTTTRMTAMLSWPGQSAAASSGVVDSEQNETNGRVLSHNVTRTVGTAANLNGGNLYNDLNADQFLVIEGIIVVSDGGDLELWSSSTSAGTTTVEAGSNLIVTRVA